MPIYFLWMANESMSSSTRKDAQKYQQGKLEEFLLAARWNNLSASVARIHAENLGFQRDVSASVDQFK